MELTKNNIEEYVARFMEGETTQAEEQAIYRFFRTSEVPAHLKEYAPMFAWYEGGMEGTPEEAMRKHAPEGHRKPLLRRIPLAAWSAGIAAMLVIAFGLGTLLYTDTDDEWACYEGSYIKVNGKCITDLKQIMPLLLAEQTKLEKQERLAEQRIRELDEREKYIREQEMKVN